MFLDLISLVASFGPVVVWILMVAGGLLLFLVLMNVGSGGRGGRRW